MGSTKSKIILEQDKLNVKEKQRANLFAWRGQFTPQFVDYIIDSFSRKGFTVIDPFSGSGTVLQTCAYKGLRGYGYEINPAAYAMSKFFSLSNKCLKDREVIVSDLQEKIHDLLHAFGGLPLFKNCREYRSRYENLIDFSKELIASISNKDEMVIALNVIFSAENKKHKDLNSAILSSFHFIKHAILSLPFTDAPIQAFLGDARCLSKNSPTKANLILTSPPYINVFNYHQNHRAVMEILGWNLLKVAHSEIGSNRKNRSNRFRTVVQYCLEINRSLQSFWHTLERNGIIVLVVGRESRVRRVPFYNGLIIKDLLLKAGGFCDIATYERHFINRFGAKIKEDIIVAKKDQSPPEEIEARKIARKHLKASISQAEDGIKPEIQDVISDIYSVHPSPLFFSKEVFQNGENTP